MEPPKEVKAVKTGWTMQKVLDELRNKHGYNLPFSQQLAGVEAPKDRIIN